MFVCICSGVTEDQIKDNINNGAKSLECLMKNLDIGNYCGTCKDVAEEYINDNKDDSLD